MHDVDGDDGVFAVLEDAAQGAFRGRREGGVDFIGRGTLSTWATKSVREPSGTGTRTAMPFSRPLSSGITSPMALAAPVLVGIMERAAERARRGSLWRNR